MIKLRELRQVNNLTQKQVADFLKCNQTAVGKYERGELEPSITNICKLADFFGCSTDYLLGREDDYGIIADKQSVVLSKDEEELLSVYRKMDANTKQQTLGFFRAAFSSNF